MSITHLFVPVDDSLLSASNVTAAVDLAGQLHARITFFHATRDFSASDDGALLRTLAPAQFAELALGETHAVLAKALASAKARQVQAQSLSRVSDRPAEAIVEAARAQGCELIVMASRGERGVAGWLHGSLTERVLRQSPLPVLVTRVASTEPLSMQERALGVIADEHRSIAAVARGLVELVPAGATGPEPADLPLVEALLDYLQQFPARQHHPKEELWLHRALRMRSPTSDALLLEIERQHAQEHALLARACRSASEARRGDGEAQRALAGLIESLAGGMFAHLAWEERVVLPLARQTLLEEDWIELATAFEANDDPGLDDLSAKGFRRVFSRLANQMSRVHAPAW